MIHVRNTLILMRNNCDQCFNEIEKYFSIFNQDLFYLKKLTEYR